MNPERAYFLISQKGELTCAFTSSGVNKSKIHILDYIFHGKTNKALTPKRSCLVNETIFHQDDEKVSAVQIGMLYFFKLIQSSI